MRAFIAVPVSPSRELKRLLRQLGMMGHAIRPASADQMHITVKFLGETNETQIADVARVVTSVCANRSSASLALRGLGVFPDERRPAVLWAGVHEPGILGDVAVALSEQLEPLGFASERRPFHPHLTLARVKARPPREFFDLLAAHSADAADGGTLWGTSEIDRVVLYQSELGRDGSKHTPLATVMLTEPG